VSENQSIDIEQIGKRIRKVRTEKGMSQAELAEKSGVSLPHISTIELGKTKLYLPTFVKLIEALEVSADSILRANVPSVNGIYQTEFSELLADCNPSELESLYSILKNLKQTMRANQNKQ